MLFNDNYQRGIWLGNSTELFDCSYFRIQLTYKTNEIPEGKYIEGNMWQDEVNKT